MMRFFSRQKQKRTASTISPGTALSPLQLPEILENVFSYLDDYTIRRSVSFVCRQWRLLVQDRLVREVTWYQGWNSARKKRALCKLPGANRFYVCCFGNGMPTLNDVLYALSRLESAYQMHLELRKQDNSVDNSNSNSKAQPMATLTPTLYDFTPLKELVLFTAFCTINFIDLLPYPSSLTKLTIRTNFSYLVNCDLGVLMRQCPALEYIHMESYSPAGISLQLTPFDSVTTRPLPLRSLVLFNASLQQCQLEALLPFTPNLKELKMKAMLWNDGISYDWSRLLQSLKANNITLNKAHFSTLGIGMSATVSEQLLSDIYPQLTSERSVWALDLTPKLFQSIISQQNTLTALEVWWMPTANFPPGVCCYGSLSSAPRIIHRQLCESLNLVHLTTLKTAIWMQDLDLFQRAGYIQLDEGQGPTLPDNEGNSVIHSGTPGIWRCRSLRTLHIEVHAPGQSQLKHPVHSRITFGYIARVCPLLEDLHICFPKTCQSGEDGHFYRTYPCLGLKGGFCLLSQLKYLQRLRVYSYTGYQLTSRCKEWELNWITAAGRKNSQSRRNRQQEIESWCMWRLYEDQVEASEPRVLTREFLLQNWIGGHKADKETIQRVQHIGLLLDVEETLKDMDKAKESRPFPSLERLSLNYPILVRPEEEIEDLFPRKRWRFGWAEKFISF